MNRKPKVLVVDDEPSIRMFVRANLEARGYEVELAKDGVEGLEMAARGLPDAVVLDINMPKMDGIEVCRRLREWTQTPVIMLSVREGEADKVKALDEGADDYVTKPFSIEELLARVRAALRRRAAAASEAPVFRSGDLEVDFSRHIARLRGQSLKLTRTEYALLAYLAANHDKVLTHRELLHNVWGPEYGEEAEYLRTFVRQLRRKIEDDPANPRFILTESRFGYRLAAQP